MPAQPAALRARGATICVSGPKTIGGIARDVEALGTLAGTDATAKPAADALRVRDAALAAKYEGAPAISVFYEVWNDPLQTIGGRHLISQALALCGGANVSARRRSPHLPSRSRPSWRRPEVIIAGSDDGRRPLGSMTGSVGATFQPFATAISSSPTAI
jgi:iron complex transport system substrate-binding protein